ncbi:MAG TPA: XRE family transcriptional regulator [Azospirillaceae bacterium]|nr:XRE family transcriptional regulator [Azospirillaceae bacterium]
MAESSNGLAALLRDYRKRRQWTLKQMSDASGVPLSTLSKVENGKVSLSYDKIQRLVENLGISLAEFFSGTAEAGRAAVTARRSISNQASALRVETSNYDYFYLCTDLRSKRMIPMLTRIRAKSLEDFGPLSSHSGEEFFFVVEGSVELHTEFYNPVVLKQGDAVYFDSSMGHAYIVKDCEEAVIVGTCSSPTPNLQDELVEIAQASQPPAPMVMARAPAPRGRGRTTRGG